MPDFLFPLVFFIVVVAVLGAVVYGIVALTRRSRDFEQIDPGIGTVRRLYFYIVSLVALMMAASGVVLVLAYVLEAGFGGDVLSTSRRQMAWGALTIVGLPLWAFHWRFIGKQVRDLPVETRSILRKLYVYLVLGISASLVVGGLVSLLRWAFGVETFEGWPWAAVVVFGAVWAYHWRIETDEGQPTQETLAVRRLYIYLVSAATLAMAAVGLAILASIMLMGGYEGLTSATVLQRGEAGLWQDTTREALVAALVGGAVWAAHWLYFARRDYDSTLRQLYLYAFTVFGGIVTIFVATGVMLYGLLVWTIGVPSDGSAAEHFRFLPGALASLVVGGGVLAYHWASARAEAKTTVLQPTGTRRAYPYVLAALGLFTLAGGIVTLVHTVIVVLVDTGPTLAGEDVWRNALAASITLGVLGTPLWAYHWTAIQRRVSVGDARAWAELPRRIFIFAILGVGMLALLGSISFLVFVFLRELLDGDLSQVLPDAKVSISMIVAAAIFVPYYWMVYRADRRVAAEKGEPEEAPRRRKAVTVLVSTGGTAFLQQLEAALGHRVSPLQWADPDASLPVLSEDELRALAQRVSDAEGRNVLLVPDSTGVQVLSYR